VLDVVVFGATGYTGRLVACALARRGARFAVAGRNPAKLDALARETGAEDARVAAVGDVDGLSHGLADARVLLSCVGPFQELGDTAVRAALAAGVHYVDSTGEAVFVERLVSGYDRAARRSRVTIAPALAFDEVPADVAATLATAGMRAADLTLTYALPSRASRGTVRSSVGILTAPGSWLRDGRRVPVVTGKLDRWAPMPPPLGPRASFAAHMPEETLAPLHLDVNGVSTYFTTTPVRRRAFAVGLPLLRAAAARPTVRRVVEKTIQQAVGRPNSERSRRARWTILAEARADGMWRNVAVVGADVYGLSAELLAAGALHLAGSSDNEGGVRAPVQAIGLDRLQRELSQRGVTINVFQAVREGE
jgi:short subunit dehydrogenase-like uncharacterized protein